MPSFDFQRAAVDDAIEQTARRCVEICEESAEKWEKVAIGGVGGLDPAWRIAMEERVSMSRALADRVRREFGLPEEAPDGQ